MPLRSLSLISGQALRRSAIRFILLTSSRTPSARLQSFTRKRKAVRILHTRPLCHCRALHGNLLRKGDSPIKSGNDIEVKPKNDNRSCPPMSLSGLTRQSITIYVPVIVRLDQPCHCRARHDNPDSRIKCGNDSKVKHGIQRFPGQARE